MSISSLLIPSPQASIYAANRAARLASAPSVETIRAQLPRVGFPTHRESLRAQALARLPQSRDYCRAPLSALTLPDIGCME